MASYNEQLQWAPIKVQNPCPVHVVSGELETADVVNYKWYVIYVWYNIVFEESSAARESHIWPNSLALQLSSSMIYLTLGAALQIRTQNNNIHAHFWWYVLTML